MKHIELCIKPALMLLLRDKYIREMKGYEWTTAINDTGFYQWLLTKELIAQIEYDRLIKEDGFN